MIPKSLSTFEYMATAVLSGLVTQGRRIDPKLWAILSDEDRKTMRDAEIESIVQAAISYTKELLKRLDKEGRP